VGAFVDVAHVGVDRARWSRFSSGVIVAGWRTRQTLLELRGVLTLATDAQARLEKLHFQRTETRGYAGTLGGPMGSGVNVSQSAYGARPPQRARHRASGRLHQAVLCAVRGDCPRICSVSLVPSPRLDYLPKAVAQQFEQVRGG